MDNKIKVEKINLDFFPLYTFQGDTALASECLNEILHGNYSKNALNTTTVDLRDDSPETSYWHPKIYSWFEEAIAVVAEEMYVPDIKMVITECWGTRTDRFQRHHTHAHPNSILSGIWYLTDHPDATTDFYLPNPWGFSGNTLRITKENKMELKSSVTPEVGKLVIFPSNLRHGTTPNNTNTPRVTIAFNVFPQGQFGRTSAHLVINVQNIRDYREGKEGSS